MNFTNQKAQQYADFGSIVEQNENITEINTPKGVHIQQLWAIKTLSLTKPEKTFSAWENPSTSSG